MRTGLAAVVLVLVAAAPARAAEQVLYVGDSLGVGTTPQLERLLGSEATIQGDSRIGRPSPEGVSVLQTLFQPSDDVVVFDLGSNDDMAQPARLAADLSSARRLTGDRCLVVATLNRPPFGGATIDGLNSVIHSFAESTPGVQLVDWHAFARGQPGLIGPDGVHATPQGYAVRAELFAEAIATCASVSSLGPPSARPRVVKPARPRRAHKPIKVPGIEASGISFTEPIGFSAGGHPVSGEVLLPNTKPPYPAVVVVPGASRAQSEHLAAHGIAALVYESRATGFAQMAAEARAAVSALRARPDVRPGSVAVLGLGDGAQVAARAAAGNPLVAAVVAVSPGLAPASDRAWAVRHALGGSGTSAITTWYRVTSGRDDRGSDPSDAWRRVAQPVLALWGTADDRVPIRAAATALAGALATGNRDHTFLSFAGASHALANQAALAATTRWLGSRLAAVSTPAAGAALPPANGGPQATDATRASGLTSPPLQLAWLVLPVLLFLTAARRTGRFVLFAAAIDAAALAAIAAGIALATNGDPHHLARLAGIPAPFALALLLAAAGAVATGVLARRRAWQAVGASALWLTLALFWLL